MTFNATDRTDVHAWNPVSVFECCAMPFAVDVFAVVPVFLFVPGHEFHGFQNVWFGHVGGELFVVSAGFEMGKLVRK